SSHYYSFNIESSCYFFFFQAEDGIRDFHVTGVQTCALPISSRPAQRYAGTDRQVRGRLLDVLRASTTPVQRSRLDVVWLTDTARSEERRVGKECGTGGWREG